MRFGFSVDKDIRFDPALLGAGLFYAALLIFAGADGPLTRTLGVETMVVFLQAALLGGALCGIVLVVASQGSRIHYNHSLHSPVVRTCVALSGALPMLAGGLLTLGCPAGSASSTLLLCAGALFGVGAMLELLAWGALFAALLPQQALLQTAMALAVTALVYTLTTLFLPAGATVPLFSVVLLLSCIPLALRTRALGPLNDGNREAMTASREFRSLGGVLWQPLFGALIAALIIGLIWDPAAAQESVLRATKSFWRYLIGPEIACALVLLFLHHSPKNFALHTVQEVFLPMSVLILMVLPYVDTSNLMVMHVADIINEFAFSIVVMVVWTSLAAAVRTTGLSPQVVFPSALTVLALVAFVGTLLIRVVGVGGKNICLILTAIYLIVLVLSFALEDRGVSESRELQHNIVERYLKGRCDELAAQYALSERECEVLLLLSRGYSQVYIAKELYISENTVRTHTRHIYAKLGIDSREGLLELIDKG